MVRKAPPPVSCAAPPAAPKVSDREILRMAREVLRVEAEGIRALVPQVNGGFAKAARYILAAKGRVIVSGIGKSGLVGRKIAATFASTGTPALFLHPVEAMHGDLGMVRGEDVALVLSNSGETDELTAILPSLRGLGATIIAMTANPDSSLARGADCVIVTRVPREACPLGLAPTASTTAMLAMGDALAVALVRLRNFAASDFRRFHPGGHLGERLRVPLREVMRAGDDLPRVPPETPVSEALSVMTDKGLGATLVVDGAGRLLGIFTDGDLRRAVREDPRALSSPIAGIMTKNPRTIALGCSVADALDFMEHHLITVLPVVDETGALAGALHLHDLLGKGKIRFTPGETH